MKLEKPKPDEIRRGRFFVCQENQQTPQRQPILLFALAEAREVVSSLGRRAGWEDSSYAVLVKGIQNGRQR